MSAKSLLNRKIVNLWCLMAAIAIAFLYFAIIGIVGSPVNAQGRGNPGVIREMPSGRPTGVDPPMGGRADNLPTAAERGQLTAMDASDGRLSRAQIARAKELEKRQPNLFETDKFGALAIRGEVLAIGLAPGVVKKLNDDGFQILREIGNEGLDEQIYVIAKNGMTSGQAIGRLRKLSPKTVFAYNHVYFESGTPGDKMSSSVSASPTGTAFAVGLIDTSVATNLNTFSGVSITHRSFAKNAIASPHGTAVASILVGKAERNGRAKSRPELYVGGVYGSDGNGGTAELLTRALGWMFNQKVAVINVSLVGPPNPVVARIIASLIGKGHLIVAPVGNDGASARPLYPASYPGVIAVSAVDSNGKLLPEASRGTRVDFVATGIAQVLDLKGKPIIVRGTSFAAPVISRRLAEFLILPNPTAAKAALVRLKSEATQPKEMASKRRFGNGLIE